MSLRDDLCVICHPEIALNRIGFVVCARHLAEANNATAEAMYRWAKRLREIEQEHRN